MTGYLYAAPIPRTAEVFQPPVILPPFPDNSLPLPFTLPEMPMVQACRERLGALKAQREVLDAEIETLEKMLAAIGGVP